MLRLSGGTYFLLLRRTPDFRSHLIDCFHRFEEALGAWEPGARVSPIFPLNKAAAPCLGDLERCWLVFFGPLSPGDFVLSRPPASFLTLGLFNFASFCCSEEERRALLGFLKKKRVRWEAWELSKGHLVDVNFSSNSSGIPQIPKKHLKPIRKQAPALRETLREYVSLFATSLGRAELFGRQFKPDLVRFDSLFRTVLDNPEVDPATRQRLLVLTNAALSRQSSQTFAGTSPITETECHFWSHSLLGVGIASLALLNVRVFLERTLSSARLVDRLVTLREVPAHREALEFLPATNNFWDRDHLFIHKAQSKLPPIGSPSDPDVLPLITCFSGRDGFRSTEVSLSAPLEVISGCNTIEWTPLTLTHEFSHRVIDGLLAQLLPNLDDQEALQEVIDLLAKEQYPNLFLQLRALLCFGLWRMDERAEQDIGKEELRLIIGTHWPSVNEIFTHCFDFLYFYRRNADVYIRAVWASWGVVPNIRLRVSQYIIRCLCAIHTQNLTRENGIGVSLGQLRLHLAETLRSYPNALYVEDALRELDRRTEYFETALSEREILVKIARFFFFNSAVERLLSGEPVVTSGDRGGYTLQYLLFTQERITNPLRFIEYYAREEAPDQVRSLWMLHHLAFGDIA